MDMKNRLNNFAEALLERGVNDEARAWLQSGDAEDSRTLGELATTAESLQLVDDAYAAGAVRVIAAEIDQYPEGENTSKLVIVLPDSAGERSALFRWAAPIAEQQGFDPDEEWGQDYLFVMVDRPVLPRIKTKPSREPVVSAPSEQAKKRVEIGGSEGITLPSMPKAYSGEFRCPGKTEFIQTDGVNLRLEQTLEGMPQGVLIYRSDMELIWKDQDDGTFLEFPADADGLLGNCDHLSGCYWESCEEVEVDGERLMKYTGLYPDKTTGQPIECLVDIETGIRRQITYFNKDGVQTSVENWVNVSLECPPQDVFELPEGARADVSS